MFYIGLTFFGQYAPQLATEPPPPPPAPGFWRVRIAARTRDRTRNYYGYAPRFAESNINDDHGRAGRLDYSVRLLEPAVLTLTRTAAPAASGFTERLLGGPTSPLAVWSPRRSGTRATATAPWRERLLGGPASGLAIWQERLLGGPATANTPWRVRRSHP
jgi:hypothetical protein